ncbi:MAG TPA: metalloregulator ArsR/SmtB family transcription factor [Polyangiales bacterium]|nr:metalloregulator ArsR/SmtB family transcription factor [Polyangiales bacterium]
MHAPIESDKRWELYRVLGEPVRLRLLALGAQEELSVGELSELLEESQSNVSRHLAALRKLGLLSERRQGTRVLVQLRDEIAGDAVVNDALSAGRALCRAEGVFERLPALIERRDLPAREFFGRADAANLEAELPPVELPAYLAAISWLLPRRSLAIEVGTGDGRLLEVLAPLFERVVAIDREPAQLDRAAARLAMRGHKRVELVHADLSDAARMAALPVLGQADVVFASRVLHHAPRPSEAFRALFSLARPGGSVLVLDYAPHEDERMREEQADLWLGFSAEELCGYAQGAGLSNAKVHVLPQAFHPAGPDAHLTWHVLVAQRPTRAALPNVDRTGDEHG